MDGTVKESREERALTIRFDASDFELIQEAARVLGEREHIKSTPTDVIRGGAVRRAQEILAQPEASAAGTL